MKVFAAQYSDCVYESAFATLSLHLTKAGAERAVENDRIERFTMSDEEQQELIAAGCRVEAFQQKKYQQYQIVEIEVQE